MAVSRKSSNASRSHSRKASHNISRKMSKKGFQPKKSSCGAGSKRIRVTSYKRAGKTVKGHFRCIKRQ